MANGRRLFSPLILLLILASCAMPSGDEPPRGPDESIELLRRAASTTGTIGVLDLKLRNGATLTQLDDPAGPMFVADMKVFTSHGTPLLADGSRDLTRIRTTTASAAVSTEIRVRGASSRFYPKKGYKLDLGTALGLLGMPVDKDWVLHSCWADKTCLRNVLGYWQAAKLFPWAPRTEFVEVFINDSYRGLYVLMENVRLSPSRVNLPAPTDNPFEISGTYVIKRNGSEAGDWASSVRPTLNWEFAAPGGSSLTATQKSWMINFMNGIFEPKFHPAYANYDVWNYDEVMDEQSAVDFMIIQELSNNVDAYWKSMHLTKQRPAGANGGLVHMGPIWDLDLAFANYNYAPEGLCGNTTWRISTTNSGLVFQPLWEMWRIWPFRQAFRDRWNALRNAGTISRTRFETKIDEFRTRIEAARLRDNRVWNTLNRSTSVECVNFPTYAEYLTQLKTWIRGRIDWMDARIAESSFINP